jgi:hypothetical protein
VVPVREKNRRRSGTRAVVPVKDRKEPEATRTDCGGVFVLSEGTPLTGPCCGSTCRTGLLDASPSRVTSVSAWEKLFFLAVYVGNLGVRRECWPVGKPAHGDLL